MGSVDWNDVNVLRKLPDGWYSAPSDSEYGKMINKDSDIKYDDSVEKAKKRHEEILKKDREIDNFVRTERLRNRSKTCSHKNYSYNGYLICKMCGLTRQGFDPFAYSGGDESRACVSKESDDVIISRLCNKASDIFENIIYDLSTEHYICSNDLLRVFKTYILTGNNRGNRNFRISARPEGLCAALL